MRHGATLGFVLPVGLAVWWGVGCGALACAAEAEAPPNRQPTSVLGTQTARVLPRGTGYLVVGTGAFPAWGGPALIWQQGVGRGGELAVTLGTLVSAATFGSLHGLGKLEYKQQLGPTRGHQVVAFDGAFSADNTGGDFVLEASFALPWTADVGPGELTLKPQIGFSRLLKGATGLNAELNGVYLVPLGGPWRALFGITPTYGFDDGAFTTPGGLGVRFSPSETAHLDVTFGQLNTTLYARNPGLLAITASIGY